MLCRVIAVLLFTNICTAATTVVALYRRSVTADTVTAQEFVVRTKDGAKVAHFGLHQQRPNEVVLLLRKDTEHFVALTTDRTMSGAIVKSGADERHLIAEELNFP